MQSKLVDQMRRLYSNRITSVVFSWFVERQKRQTPKLATMSDRLRYYGKGDLLPVFRHEWHDFEDHFIA